MPPRPPAARTPARPPTTSTSPAPPSRSSWLTLLSSRHSTPAQRPPQTQPARASHIEKCGPVLLSGPGKFQTCPTQEPSIVDLHRRRQHLGDPLARLLQVRPAGVVHADVLAAEQL